MSYGLAPLAPAAARYSGSRTTRAAGCACSSTWMAASTERRRGGQPRETEAEPEPLGQVVGVGVGDPPRGGPEPAVPCWLASRRPPADGRWSMVVAIS